MQGTVVVDGLGFPEGPRWRDGRLWFSDMAGRVVVVEPDGSTRTVVEDIPGGPPSGLGWLPDGRLLMVATEGRSLLALEPDGTLSTHADLSGVASFGCNDMVVDAQGRAYVGCCDIAGIPQPSPSAVIVVHPDGRAEVGDAEMRFPNGSVITPDGTTLIVAETFGQCLTAFSIDADGTIGDKREWAAVPGMLPDGICLDQEGCVWFADATGNACVRVAEGGEVRDRIDTDQGAFACTLGGDDGRTLFAMTSSWPIPTAVEDRKGQVVAYEVEVPGTGSP
jgi:sugar lactone lactonase YvrE